jgi:oligoribonuclease NrnB/cAMP/cGMP phosphodiesterase (DHH superfamily)
MTKNLAKELSGRLLITHTDLDGVGCAIVYNKCFPGVANHFANYDGIDEMVTDLLASVPHDTPIMMSDLSIKTNELADRLQERGNFELVDHHPTAKWLMEGYQWALVNTEKSATMLMYEVMSTRFNIEDLLPLVTLVNNYDTWGGGAGPSEDAKALNRLLGILGIPRFLSRFLENSSVKLTDSEKLLLQLKEEEITKFISDVVKSASVSKDAGGNTYAMIAIDRFISEACHAVLEKYQNIEYVMAVDFIGNKVSLRGRGNLDLGKMAKNIGGGGHKQSAGFPIQHGSQLRMVLACQGTCPVTENLKSIIRDGKRS